MNSQLTSWMSSNLQLKAVRSHNYSSWGLRLCSSVVTLKRLVKIWSKLGTLLLISQMNLNARTLKGKWTCSSAKFKSKLWRSKNLETSMMLPIWSQAVRKRSNNKIITSMRTLTRNRLMVQYKLSHKSNPLKWCHWLIQSMIGIKMPHMCSSPTKYLTQLFLSRHRSPSTLTTWPSLT